MSLTYFLTIGYNIQEIIGNNKEVWHNSCDSKEPEEAIRNLKYQRRSEMFYFTNIALIVALLSAGKAVWGKAVWGS